MNSVCALCGLQITFSKIIDEGKHFCCHGCQAVFQILSLKNELTNSQNHPLYLQALKSGIISNPTLLKELEKNEEKAINEETKNHYFEIQNMWCYSCAELIKLILLKKKGIKNCKVDYTTDLASICYNPKFISKEEIYEIIQKLGYQPSSLEVDLEVKTHSYLKLRCSIAAFCSLNIMMFSYPIYASLMFQENEDYTFLLAILAFIASLPLVTWCFWPIFRKCLNSIKVGLLGMEVLVVIGVTSSFLLSVYNLIQQKSEIYFDSMSAIITLVLLGKIIESKAKFSSKEIFCRIIKHTPKKARKRTEEGNYIFVPTKEIAKGDILYVVTGEKITLDGKVTEGEGICDESIMTGEPFPQKKKKGDSLLAGTFLQHGSLHYEVTSDFEQSLLQKIFDSIYQDLPQKLNYFRLVDIVIQFFIPSVIFLSIITGIVSFLFLKQNFSEIFRKMISILLISCPCAIGIAAPLVESYLIKAISLYGGLIKNRASLLLLSKITHFFADKTGTITEGKFHVITGLNEIPSCELKILKAMTSSSTHPIAFSVNQNINVTPEFLDKIEEFSGKGIKGYKDGVEYIFGSKKFLEQEDAFFTDKNNYDENIMTHVFFSKKKYYTYSIALGDTIKIDAKEMISSLRPITTALISGDSNKSVHNVAKSCNFNHFYSEISPLMKREIIEEEKKKGAIIAMLGDGINDAPALSAAHIGISVISAADISIHVSDLFLTTKNLDVIPKIINLSIKGQKIIRQNLFWAFFYNIIGITLAILGLLTPIFSALAMILSSSIVVLNARRVCKNLHNVVE